MIRFVALAACLSALSLRSAEWEDQRVTSVNRLPARADVLPETRFVRSLNGDWRFCWSPTPDRRPVGFERTDYDDSAWTTIDVPSCVEMRGWGIPLYVHIGYPFPKRPPYVNRADNPVSNYRRTFSVPGDWRGRRSILRFEGVASAFHVWVNGRHVGYSEDSFGTSEFDVTSCLNASDAPNLLCVEVYRWSDGSYIEDQDMFRFSGVFRDVKLWSMPNEGVWDFAVKTLPVDGYAKWELEMKAEGEQRVSAILCDADGKKVGDLHCAPAPHTYACTLAARAWSAEDPYLYTLVVKKGEDVRTCRVGFREVKIEGNRFLVNGRPVVFRGVNRHASEPANGWTVSDSLTESDVVLMKRHNIDTVRTSHHPDRPAFYDLCDRYGLYVVAEANVEAHGLGSHGTNCVGTLPGWEIPIVERNIRHVRNLRNHPCVVMWSLGNESGPGPAFVAARDAVRSLDPTRPVHYESDEKMSDVRSVMYPSVATVRKHANDRDKPFFLCEYAHAMGNALGNFAEYMEAFLSGPATCGGCVWDWSDQAVWKASGKVNPDGSPGRFLAYGGDWGEKADGAYCCNGLVDPLRRFSPKLEEVSYVYRRIVVRRETSGFELENRHAFTSADAFAGRWELVEDGQSVREGPFDVPPVGPGSRDSVPALDKIVSALPTSAAERFLNISFVTKADASWAKKGFAVAREQLALGTPPALPMLLSARPSALVALTESDDEVVAACGRFKAVFSRAEGGLVALELDGRPVLAKGTGSGPRLGVARAYVDNDIYLRQRHKRSPKDCPTFRESGLESLTQEVQSMSARRTPEGDVRVVCAVRLKGTGEAGFLHVSTWTFETTGRVRIENEVEPFGKLPFLMRVGMDWRLDPAFERMTWYGRGPHENYIDRCSSAFFGRYDSTVTDQYVDYVRPQDCGYKADVRWLALADAGGHGIRFSCDRPLFVQALHYSRADLDGARHWKGEPARNALPAPRSEVYLNLDVRQLGLGNASCGPRPLDVYGLEAGPERWTLVLESVDL